MMLCNNVNGVRGAPSEYEVHRDKPAAAQRDGSKAAAVAALVAQPELAFVNDFRLKKGFQWEEHLAAFQKVIMELKQGPRVEIFEGKWWQRGLHWKKQ